MAKSKKASAAEKSPAATVESAKKKATPRKPSQSRSKSQPRSQARSKSRSRKPTHSKVRGRSRTRSRSRSKSPRRRSSRPRSRSRSVSVKRAPSTRSRARSKSRGKPDPLPNVELVDIVQSNRAKLESKPHLLGGYSSSESKLKDIIRRSVSRELSQEKANSYRFPAHTSGLTNLKEEQSKNNDGYKKMASKSVFLPKKRLSWSFSVPAWFKTLVGLVVFPLIVLLLQLQCRYNQCNLDRFNVSKNWRNYFNYKSAGLVVGFFFLQALLSLLPIGKKVEGPAGVNGSVQYRCNGLLCTFLTIGMVAGLWHYGFPVTIVHDKLISLLTSSIIFAYVLAFLLFVKGGRAPIPALNPTSIMASRFQQFYIGREVNPFLFRKVNVKVVLIRTCMNGMLLLNALLALKTYGTKPDLHNALGTSVVINALLALIFFWFENSFPSTFEAMYEGTGCMLTLRYMLQPFLTTLITRYIIQQKVELPLFALAAIGVGVVIGLYIYTESNLQKSTFRKCALDPALSKLEAISTSRGKKLLVAGWWGCVRHPNYLGFILLHWAWASTSGVGSVLPYFVPAVVTVMMMLRAKRVDAFCSNRYQSSWDDYCNRVPKKIFPRVY